MGRFTDAINWGKHVISGGAQWGRQLLQREITAATLTDAANYSYKTIDYLFQQAASIPAVVRSVVIDPSTRTVARHLLRVGIQDVALMSAVTYGSVLIREQGVRYLGEQYPDYVNSDTSQGAMQAIQTGLFMAQLAAWVIWFNRKIDAKTRLGVVSVEASPMLTRGQLASVECPPHCQSGLKGPISNIAGYWVAYAGITLVGWGVPWVGGSIATVLEVYLNGQFILTLALPKLCNDHLSIYFRENHELVLSLGLGHAANAWLINSLVERVIGVPPIFKYAVLGADGIMIDKYDDIYASAIKELLMIIHVMFAVNLVLPATSHASTRARTPVLLLQDGVDFGVEVTLELLKNIEPIGKELQKIISRRINGQQLPNFPNPLQYLPSSQTMKRRSIQIHQNLLVQTILPSILRSQKLFVRDPIVVSSWIIVQPIIIQALKDIESLPNYWAVWLASCVPTVSGELAKAIAGAPPFVTKFLLHMITRKDVIEQLREVRYVIETLGVAAPAPRGVGDDILPLPGQPARKAVLSSALLDETELDNTELPEAQDVIRARGQSTKASLPPAAQVIRFASGTSHRPAANTTPSAAEVIRRHGLLRAVPQRRSKVEEDWVHVEEEDVSAFRK